jgi:hypothetical protein
MVICGTQIPAKARRGSNMGTLGAQHGIFRSMSLVKILGVVVVFLSLLSGCLPSVKFGYPPRVENLASLQPGVSTTENILLSLGEPRGSGKVKFTPDMEPRSIWYYEYVESSGKKASLKFLLVFVDKDIYDGHLWFASSYTHKVD